MQIKLFTDGENKTLASATDRVMLSVQTDGIAFIKNIKYQVFARSGEQVFATPFLTKDSNNRYEYFDAGLFDDRGEYAWRAIVSTDKEDIVSEYAYFEKGISHDNFKAKWIDNPDFDGRVSEFLNKFIVNGKVEKARLYAVGLGFSDAFINGTKTDEFYFKPVLTDFDKRVGLNNPHYNEENFGGSKKTVCYDTFDVTKLLRQGENKLTFLLGTGWYCNEDKNFTDPSYSYADPKLLFELHIKTDCGEQIILSDESCLVRNTNIKSQMFAGDFVDFTACENAFTLARLCAPPTGKLEPNRTRNDKVIEEIEPKATVKKGNLIEYDFGKNHTGTLLLKVKGKKGSKLIINYYENKKDGEVNPITSRWYAYKDGLEIIGYLDQTSEYLLSGGEDDIIPYFHWNCYRYATVESEEDFEVISVKSLFIASDIKIDGEFCCSDEFLNRFNQAFVLTQLDNMHCGIPSDCPTRERLPYTGDGQLVAETVTYSFDSENFYRKWLRDIIDSQGANGFVSNTAPIIAGGGGFWWTNALVVIPTVLYNYTGDKKIIEDAYPACKKLLAFYDGIHNGDYVMRKSYIKWFLGDWCTPDKTVIDIPYVNTLAAYYATEQVIRMCDVLNLAEDKERYENLKERFKKAINDNYFDDKSCDYAGGVQGANLMPAINGVADKETAKKLIDKIVAQYEKDTHFDTGIIMTPVILDVLSAAGREDLALKLLTQKSAPSFYDMLDGETTLVEFWIKHDPSKSTISHCHPMFGSVLAWVYKNVGGMDLSKLYDKKIIFAPKLIKQIPSSKISKITPYGLAQIEYSAEKEFLMKIKVPFGLTAEVVLPEYLNDIEVDGKKQTKKDGESFIRFELLGGDYVIKAI